MPGFTSPPDPALFKAFAWEIVRQVPAGKVATYGQVASFILPPAGVDPKDYTAWAPRWVGGAMAACPAGVPWQRVLNAQGKISLPPAKGGTRQRELLESEGIVFDVRGRIDLHRFGWQGPSRQWLVEHGLVMEAE